MLLFDSRLPVGFVAEWIADLLEYGEEAEEYMSGFDLSHTSSWVYSAWINWWCAVPKCNSLFILKIWSPSTPLPSLKKRKNFSWYDIIYYDCTVLYPMFSLYHYQLVTWRCHVTNLTYPSECIDLLKCPCTFIIGEGTNYYTAFIIRCQSLQCTFPIDTLPVERRNQLSTVSEKRDLQFFRI